MTLHSQIVIACALGTSLIVTGCGNQQTEPPKKPTVSKAPLPAVSTTSESPPPPPTAPPNAPPSAPAAATAAKPDSGDAVAFYRPRDNQGNLASDLEVLNSALMAYGTDGVQRPPFHDLSDLVKAGLIKKLPTPPPGKKYVFDPKTGQAKLENQ